MGTLESPDPGMLLGTTGLPIIDVTPTMKMKPLYAIGALAVLLALMLFGWQVMFSRHLAKDPRYRGHPLSYWLRNINVAASTHLTLDQLLTPTQTITGEEPDIATFEVPISYDVVTNIGVLLLLVDAEAGESQSSKGDEFQECDRATNGNCLLAWNTTYAPPGQHYVQAHLIVGAHLRKTEALRVTGPPLRSIQAMFVSSYRLMGSSQERERFFLQSWLGRMPLTASSCRHPSAITSRP